jgi:predicted nucleotidyltransferase
MSVKLELDLQTLLLQRLHSSPAAIEQFCKRWKITEFSLFGSVLREDFAPSSDVDVLVVFASRHGWNLFDFMDMQDELTAQFRRPVDLLQKKELVNPYRRKVILETHQVIYEQ